jgi:hypothetical protein
MISTTDLLEALRQVEVRDFNADVFWRRVSESSGPVFSV